MKSAWAVLAGAITWAVLWLGLNQLLFAVAPGTFAEGQPITSTPALLGLWVSSVAFSILAGTVTATVARRDEVRHAAMLGGLQLALGVFFQVQYWTLMPIWYHVLFLACLFPANVAGGVLRKSRAAEGARPAVA